MTKKETILKLEETREDMIDLLDSLEEDEYETTLPDSDWTIKDLLFHITMWEAELIKLLFQLQRGQKPTTVHYGNKSIDDVNEEWYEMGKQRDLDQVYDDFIGAREQTIRRLAQFSDDDLQKIISFPYGEMTLEERIAQDSYAHEKEHLDELIELFDLD